MKKVGLLLVLLLLCVCLSAAAAVGLDVSKHTIEEIQSFIATHPTAFSGDCYAEEPVVTGPNYSPGKLTSDYLQSALNALNQVRYAAGIGANVTLNETYNEKCQAGVLINAVNNVMSHQPTQPADMEQTLYDLGYSGTSSSNLGSGYATLSAATFNGWMHDGGSSNIPMVGHRRWALNPKMAQTGFGHVGRYTAMYSFDRTSTASVPKRVAWPAQVMPVRWMSASLPWSISYSGGITNTAAVHVNLVREKDGAEWNFSSSASDGYFNINTAGYGCGPAVIFRPENITYSPGDHFTVTVTGAETETLIYTVDLYSFDIEYATLEVTESPVYTGSALQPAFTVKMNGTELEAGKDYTFECSYNINVTNYARITITGMGKYSGTLIGYFTIQPADLSGAAFDAIVPVVYDGRAKLPAVTGSFQGVALTRYDFSTQYEQNTDAGTASITLTGKGNYTGTTVLNFVIQPADINDASSFVISSSLPYNGEALEPEVRVNFRGTLLNRDESYTLTYSNNINAGTAGIIVKGIGNFNGEKELSFTINQLHIYSCDVTIPENQLYSGETFDLQATVTNGSLTLVRDTDYKLEWYIEGTDGCAYFTGLGNYTGTKAVEFTVTLPEPEETPGNGSETEPPPAGPQSGHATDNGSIFQTNGDTGTAVYVGPEKRTLGSVTIPASIQVNGYSYQVTEIKDSAFAGMTRLKDVTIGKNVKMIGKNAFNGCKNLKKVSGGANVTTIGESAFRDCKALTAITLPKKLKKIGKNAFLNCAKLKTINIKTKELTQKSVGSNAFKGVYKKVTVRCPSGMKKTYETLLRKKGLDKKAKFK